MSSPPLLPRLKLRTGDPNDLMRELVALARALPEDAKTGFVLELYRTYVNNGDDGIAALIRVSPNSYVSKGRETMEQMDVVLRRYGAEPWHFNEWLDEWHRFERLPIPFSDLLAERSAREMLDLVPRIPPGRGGFVVIGPAVRSGGETTL